MTPNSFKTLFMALFLLAATATANASPGSTGAGMIPNTESATEHAARMKWWNEARFGMFVHWGLYSIAGGEWGGKQYPPPYLAEWIQKYADVSAAEYEKTLVPQFKPSSGFAGRWASLAKEAGAEYVVFTCKHHDGFSLHDSAETTFDAKDATGRDLAREIIDAIRAEHLGVGVFYSLWDWHHPDAPAGKGAVNIKGATMAGRSLQRYVDYFHSQINEITDGRYGKIDILWLDYSKPNYQGCEWGARELVSMVRSNQPGIIINNRLWVNRLQDPDTYAKYWMGDFLTPEQHIPAVGIKGIDWEACDTLNGTWGWCKYATAYKSLDDVLHRMIDTVSKGGNYLLNIGPLPDGSIDPVTRKIMAGIGAWMRINGEAVYGTQAGPFARLPWGCATSKELGDGRHKLYLHVFDWPPAGELPVPGLQTIPSRVALLGGADTGGVRVEKRAGKVIISGLPDVPPHPAASVVMLEFDEAPSVSPYRVYASYDGSFTLEPADAEIETGVKFVDSGLKLRSSLKNWKTGGEAVFPLFVEEEGAYMVRITAATHRLDPYNKYALSVGGKEIPLTFSETGGLSRWKEFECGPVVLPAGDTDLMLRCRAQLNISDIAVSRITLTPEK